MLFTLAYKLLKARQKLETIPLRRILGLDPNQWLFEDNLNNKNGCLT